jgi:hypothetical protein
MHLALQPTVHPALQPTIHPATSAERAERALVTSTSVLELDLLLAMTVFAVVLWLACRWLLRAERAAAGGHDDPQPTVRRTNPASPIHVSAATDTTRAPRYATVGMVSIDGVSAARRPSLTYTSGLISTPNCSHGIESSAAQG